MYIVRLLVAILIIWIALRLLRRYVEHRRLASTVKKQIPAATMVRCAYCKLHIPEQEALISGSLHYCSDQHRNAAQRG